jgi:hypothetical protein
MDATNILYGGWLRLWDGVMSLSNKFAYRVLEATGASETAKSNFLLAVKEKTDDRIAADKELSEKVPLFRTIFWVALIALAVFVVLYLVPYFFKKKR